MSVRTTLTDPVAEKATAFLSATITDTDGVTPLANADTVLISLTLTLYDERTGTVINSCTDRSIKNTGGGTVSAAGAVSVRLDPLDMAILGGRSSEQHVALFTWTWGSPLATGRYEIAFTVTNLEKVT
jgi:hypothetical protein